jgi:dCMP deaminase
MEWSKYFYEMANLVAKKSKDKSTQIGAVIVGPDNEIRSTGYNSFPSGINDDLDIRQQRPEKYYWIEHAERNALYNASKIGVSTKNCVMYLNCGVPCCDCARGIINSGIRTIYIREHDITKSDHWMEHSKRSKIMFSESDVRLETYSFLN